jgi:hypothetical protein
MGGDPDVHHLWHAAMQGMGAGRWAHGEMVQPPPSMREGLDSMPNVFSFEFDVSPRPRVTGHAGAITKRDSAVPGPRGASWCAMVGPLA